MSGVLFVLMRHAPTPWNEAGRLQGSADIGLSRSQLNRVFDPGFGQTRGA